MKEYKVILFSFARKTAYEGAKEIHLTKSVAYAMLQEVLDLYARQGWRMVQYDAQNYLLFLERDV